jgi:hypothetical protein
MTLGRDGTVYVATICNVSAGVLSPSLFAINPNGSQKWRVSGVGCGVLAAPTGADPAIDGSGRILLPEVDGLHAINPDGTPAWFFATNGNGVGHTPAIDGAGNIYYGVDSSLKALDSSGHLKWSYPTNYGNPYVALGADGTIYAYYDLLYALNPNGSLKWSYFPTTLDQMGSGLAIGPDSTIYISFQGGVGAINSVGNLLWQTYKEGSTSSPPSVDADGTIYLVNPAFFDGLVEMNPDGSTRQMVPGTGALNPTQPVIAANGQIYTTGDDAWILHAFGPP